ncbi:tRNA (adenosine(37)-N6)-threonylcarbamoyltransferase complex transferase subunit TsaD [Ponticaulis sp.]|uniref:tRNA (adenosine(37)-N6)-threonylcarbamoyltransferase complex transferase subunit TsaD n=1 Tax=Ponticaulis sp. TaxID=2020902 RepID=UPI002600EB19|nr:tRNA (adenosine(37)-N6)-threonylcarbamoyltransferase complex transferase subunit TsaD [Ponticaulis sp.]
MATTPPIMEQAPDRPILILGIETSCDETAAAVVRLDGGSPEVLGEVISSQFDEHKAFGGVVPEIAARAHADMCDNVVRETLDRAGVTLDQIDGFAATSGPGLIGGVMVGMMTAKALAMATDKPFIGVNHLEGHALSPRLGEPVEFPYLLLLVSGGHCQFLSVEGLGQYKRLGSTIDDAVGEAFDKTAKVLGLGFPGGPAVERYAKTGNENAIKLPKPLLDRPGLDMSFAGLKTAVLREAQNMELTEQALSDISASFQKTICEILTEKSRRAMRLAREELGFEGEPGFVIAGGVGANTALRNALKTLCEEEAFSFHAPPLKWCTDNGAMIAYAGAMRFKAGQASSLDLAARPRWPLDEAAAEANPVFGGGKRGAKA